MGAYDTKERKKESDHPNRPFFTESTHKRDRTNTKSIPMVHDATERPLRTNHEEKIV